MVLPYKRCDLKLLKRIYLSIAMVLVVLIGIALPVLAVDTWKFYFPVNITDNSSTNRTNVPVLVGFAGQNFVTSSFINANATDTRFREISTDKKYMMSTTQVPVVVSTLPNQGTVTYNFYTGFSPLQTLFPIVVGHSGNITTADHADLHLSDNFSITAIGGFNTDNGTNKNIIAQQDAIKVYVSPTVSGNITASLGTATGVTEVRVKIYRATGSGSIELEEVQFLDADGVAVLPTGNNDASGNWTNEINAYDNNIGTYASSSLGAASWTGYLGFTHASMTISGVKFYIIKPDAGVTQVSIDYYNQGVWHSLYEGVFTSATWTTKSVLSTSGAASVSATGVASGEHTVTVEADGTLFGISANQTPSSGWPITDNLTLNLPLYHTALSGSTFTSVDKNALTATVTGATWGIQGRDFNPGTPDYITIPASATQLNFTTQSFSVFANLKIDDLTVNRAVFVRGISSTEGYLFWISTTGKISVRTCQALANQSSSSAVGAVTTGVWYEVGFTRSGADIKIYRNGTDVTSTVGVHIDPDTSAQIAKIGIWTDTASFPFDGIIRAIRIYNIALTPTQVTANRNATKWKDDGSNNFFDYVAAVSVPSNSNNYTFMQYNSMIYADNISISVGGVQKLLYRPAVMLSGTTLPDLAGTAQNGVITWGSNDQIIISYGAMTSYESTSGATAAGGGFTLPTVPIPAQWYASGTGLAALPFYDYVNDIATTSGIPVQTLFMFFVIGGAVAFAMLILEKTRSLLLTLIVLTVILVIGSIQTIIPLWMMFTYLVLAICLMYLYLQFARGG